MAKIHVAWGTDLLSCFKHNISVDSKKTENFINYQRVYYLFKDCASMCT